MTAPFAVIAEADLGSASTRGRPPERHWMVRLRRGSATVIVAIGLHHAAAEHLAQRINELLNQQPPGAAIDSPTPTHGDQLSAHMENHCPPERSKPVRPRGDPNDH
jgi:hypothetical protein